MPIPQEATFSCGVGVSPAQNLMKRNASKRSNELATRLSLYFVLFHPLGTLCLEWFVLKKILKILCIDGNFFVKLLPKKHNA